MFKLFRPRLFLSRGPAVLLHPPPAPPTSTPFRQVTARNISLNRPPPTHPQKHTSTRPLHSRPIPRSSTTTQTPTPTTPRRHTYQQNHHRPPPHDPSYRTSRLQTAKPLLTWRAINSPPTYTIIAIAIAGGLIFYFANLETVPVSGRTRFNVYSTKSVQKAGEMEHKRLLYELESKGVRVLPEWDARVQRVRRVMGRLIPFSGMAGEEWEVFVVDDARTANAFVLPGGKVFVFSGILGLARNDSGLATVLGHEIAHNLADHVGERLSQDIGASIVLYSLMILGGAFGLGPLIMHFFGSRFLDVAFGFPMSRLQESEADYIGLMMMAEACYDPAEAASFWARMEKAAGQEVPEWMSTHPANINRIKKIQEWLPEAMEKRAQSDCSTTASFADLFRHALRTGQVIMV